MNGREEGAAAASDFAGISARHRRRRVYYLAGLVLFVTVASYVSALRNEFVNWDDGVYVVDNRHIRSLNGEFFRWAFGSFYASNWHPLTWISHAIDYAVWGQNPLGHHLTNIILHALNTVLVVLLAVKLFEAGRERAALNGSASFLNDRSVLIAAGTTGILFGIHPVHVESVAWVAERKDLLCGLFFLLSVIGYANYAVERRAGAAGGGGKRRRLQHFVLNRHYLSALGFFVLALLSKPMAVTLPVVLLILDWYPFDRISSPRTLFRAVIEKAPFAALSLASSLATIMAQKSGGAVAAFDVLPLPVRMTVAAKALIHYLVKLVLPLDLLPFYAYPRAAEVSLFHASYLSAVFFLVAITIVCVTFARKGRALPSAWAYYLVTLIPVLGIVQVGSQMAADRYAYLPGIGPFVLAGLGAAWSVQKADAVKGRGTRIAVRLLVVGLAAGCIITLAGMTFRQVGIWRNSVILWTHAVEQTPDAVFPRLMRAAAFKSAGQIERAVQDYAAAISLAPQGFIAYYNLGNILLQAGRIDEAIGQYQRALSLRPDYAEGHNNLAAAFEEKGLLDDAIEQYRIAVGLKPDYADGHYNLGLAYGERGLLENAEAHLQTAVALDPDNQTFRRELARISAHLKTAAEAEQNHAGRAGRASRIVPAYGQLDR